MADRLRYAKALILPLPRLEYTAQEITEIEHFVDRGGRVFIIGDPARTVTVEALNSIASAFGIIYANDYLYSLKNNDNNYRNVIYTTFKDSPVTRGLSGSEHKVIFYGGGSVSAPGHEVILGDENTYSSTSEGGRSIAAAALTTNDQVLALGDLTFFSEPYSAAEDNGTFINNIADFLTGGQRDFEMQDFPYFLNPQVDIVFENTMVFNSQFEHSVKLKDFLENQDRTVSYTDAISQTGNHDVIFVGRFADVKDIKNYLDKAGITILPPEDKSDKEIAATEAETQSTKIVPASDMPAQVEGRFVRGRIRIDGVGDLERGGSTLFYLNQDQGRNVLIILSDNPDTNADAFDLLLKNKLNECQVSPMIAVCQTEEPNGGLPPSLRSTRIDNILVVGGDTGRPRDDQQTGLLEFSNALSQTYKIDTWLTSQKGSPDINQLLNYDAVIWATGDYWDDSISEDAAALLTKYAEVGGNLILSGASIAFDWDHTDFLTKVVHADYTGTGEQKDLEVALPDHPIAAGFAEGEVITFTNTITSSEKLEIDVVENTPDARVIFQRGPGSQEKGAASVIAYEDDRVKIAYFAFPIYLLPAEQQNLLISNTVAWFTKKPLDLPKEQPAVDKKDKTTGSEEDKSGAENGQKENGSDNQDNGDQGNNQDNQNDNNQDTGNGDNGQNQGG